MSPEPKRILIVEDDRGLMLLFCEVLRRAGHQCCSVDTGQACIDWLMTNTCDLMLLDYSLPDFLAPAVVEKLRPTGRLGAFIVITGHGGERIAVEMMKLGARDYVVKDSLVFERLPNVVTRIFQELDHEGQLGRAEAALRAEQERADGYFENVAVMMLVLDRQARVVRVNRKGCEILGWEREALVGASWIDQCLPVSVREPLRVAFAELMAGAGVRLEYYENPVLTRSGEERLMAWHNSVTLDASGRIVAVLSSAEDITDRRRMEETLRESEEKFAKAFRDSPVPMAIRDVETNRYLDANDRCLALMGYTRGEVIGRQPEEIGWMDEADSRDSRQGQTADGGIVDRAMRLRRKDGTRIDTLYTAHAVQLGGQRCLLSVTVDVTDRLRVEAELKCTTALLEQALAQSPIPMLLVSMPEAVFRIVNPACREFLGMGDEPSLVGQPLAGFVPGFRVFDLQGALERADDRPLTRALRGEPSFNREQRIVRKDGTSVWALVSGVPIINDRREVIAAYLIMVDITARKRAEEMVAWEVALVENSNDMCCVKDLDLRVRAVNSAFLRAAGVESVAAVLGKTDMEIFGWEGNRANCEGYMADERRAQTFGPGESIMREEARTEPDGSRCMLLTRKFPVFDAAGRLIATANVSTDITAHRRMEDALEANERRYRLLFASNVAGVALHQIVCDAAGRPCDYRFLEVNLAFEQITGLRAVDLIGHTVLEVMPQTEPTWIERYGRVALTGDADHFEDYSRVLDRYYEVSAYSPERGQFAVMVLDVTLRKRAESALQESLHEKEALLKEVHHRVKNNLQVISSLLRLEAGQLTGPEGAAQVVVLRNMQERVRAMALLHENLYRSGNLAAVNMEAYLGMVCQQLLRAGAARIAGTVNLQLNLEPLRLEMNQALPCGLLVNELVSNCLKHAFPGERGGTIWVSLQPVASGSEWCLRVEDDGVGLPPGLEVAQLRSLGLQLVSDLSRQIQGRLERIPGEGTRFAIAFKPRVEALSIGERTPGAPAG